MSDLVRKMTAEKLGALMLANTELVAANSQLIASVTAQKKAIEEKDAEIAKLNARISVLEDAANEPRLPLPVEPDLPKPHNNGGMH